MPHTGCGGHAWGDGQGGCRAGSWVGGLKHGELGGGAEARGVGWGGCSTGSWL